MQLILPDVLTAARGLSPGAAGFLLLVGLLLWAVGWRWHRFWIVAGISLAAGLLGLNAGRAAGGTQIMAAGILLAVAAGMMALELAKVFAFVAGGCGAWLAAQWVFPQAQELWAVFLSGGLFGLLLYKLWTMLLTSLGGTTYDWASVQTVVLAVSGAVLLTLFVFAERRAAEPILPLALFRVRTFSVAGAISFIVGVALFGSVTYLPLYLQIVKGFSAVESGLLLTPMMAGVLITSIASGQVTMKSPSAACSRCRCIRRSALPSPMRCGPSCAPTRT